MKAATYVRCFLVIMMAMLPGLAEAKKFKLKTLQDYAESLKGQPVSTLVEKWGTPVQDYTSPETGAHIIKWKHWEEGAGAWMAAGGSCELDFTVDDKDSTIKSFMGAATSGHLPTALTLAPHPCKFFLKNRPEAVRTKAAPAAK